MNEQRLVTYQRFSVLNRFLHLVVMIGFTGLAATGLSLAFSSLSIAKAFIWLLGGAGHAAWLHRFFAVTTYLCVIIHGIWFLYYRFVLDGSLTGPHSILFNKKDLYDFRDNILYFFGKKDTPPKFERFTYMEKMDYWAIFIGMNTMGITGLFLWFPEAVTSIFPGFFINIARTLHFLEAVLAVLVKFFIHIAMAHLRPEVYPADMSIFTGRTSIERMKKEHTAEWERLFSTGKTSETDRA